MGAFLNGLFGCFLGGLYPPVENYKIFDPHPEKIAGDTYDCSIHRNFSMGDLKIGCIWKTMNPNLNCTHTQNLHLSRLGKGVVDLPVDAHTMISVARN